MQYLQVLFLAASLITGTAVAAPSENVELSPVVEDQLGREMSPRDTEAINPFAGMSILPHAKKNCNGKGQGNTNINLGTTACINWSKAKSYYVTMSECPTSPEVHYFHNTECPKSEKPYRKQVLGANSGCYNLINNRKHGGHGSGLIHCAGAG